MQPPSPSADSPTIRIEPPDPARLAEQICTILTDDNDPDRRVELLLHQAVGLVNAAGAYYYRSHGDKVELAGQLVSKQALGWSDDLAGACGDIAFRAIAERRASLTPLPDKTTVSLISCPVSGPATDTHSCLSVLAILGDHPAEPYLIVLQLLAATLAQIETGSGSSSLLQSVSEVSRSSDSRSLGDGLRKWAGCDIVAIGMSERNGAPKLSYVSDVATPDKKTHRSRLYLKVMREALRREVPLTWPQDSELAPESSLLIKELVHDTGMQQGVCLGLRGAGNGAVIIVMLWGAKEDRSVKLDELKTYGGLLGPFFYQTMKDQQRRGAQGDTGGASVMKKALVGAVLLLFGIWFFVFPMNFRLHPEAQVKPVQLRYVVAKFDGIIAEVFVEPGNRVEQGKALARLDGREIALELSSLTADSTKALKVRDNHHVGGDVAAAQIAQLEYQRLQERSSLLSMRQEQLEIKSPASGIVLSGDIKRRTGGPVSRGQVLFEIAPLDTVLVELGIVDGDIGHVSEGLEVEVRFDAFPGRVWHGTVEKLSPASQLIDGKNLFTATFELDNQDGTLQPGMRGDGLIHAGQRSPAWIYFHKPAQWLMRLLRSLF